MTLRTERLRTLEQVQGFLDGNEPANFELADRASAYAFQHRYAPHYAALLAEVDEAFGELPPNPPPRWSCKACTRSTATNASRARLELQRPHLQPPQDPLSYLVPRRLGTRKATAWGGTAFGWLGSWPLVGRFGPDGRYRSTVSTTARAPPITPPITKPSRTISLISLRVTPRMISSRRRIGKRRTLSSTRPAMSICSIALGI